MKETKRKIYFLPYSPHKGRESKKDIEPFVVVSTKYNKIGFTKKTMQDLDMTNKFIKFYFEPASKKIAWITKKNLDEAELKSKSWRLVKLNKTGQFQVSITGILKEFKNLKPGTYKPEVQKYIDVDQSHLGKGTQIYYFVELNKDSYHNKLKKTGGDDNERDTSEHQTN